MRTTLELPDQLLKKAKIEAIERGISLKDLIGSALEKELSRGQSAPRRVEFPIFRSANSGLKPLSAADIAAMEADEDLRRSGLSS